MSEPADTPRIAVNPFRGAEATTADLVECFGVTKAYIGKLATEGKLEKAGPNRWDAFTVVRQFTEMLRNRKVNQHDSDGPEEIALEYERDKARKMRADADIAEITADLMAGRVHEAKAVEELWTSLQMAARAKLLGLPSALAAEAPKELSAMVLRKTNMLVREALEQLSDYDPIQIAERTDRKRVCDSTPTPDDAPLEAATVDESE